MSDAKDQTVAFNVRLKPSEPSAHPRVTNYTNVGMAQGIAYLDFGFIEPTLLAAIAKTAKDGKAAPKGIEGALVTTRRDERGCIGPIASADSASTGQYTRPAIVETTNLITSTDYSEYRREALETEARRGFSQIRPMQRTLSPSRRQNEKSPAGREDRGGSRYS